MVKLSFKSILKKAFSNIKKNFSKFRKYIFILLLAILSILFFGKYALSPLLYIVGIVLGYYTTMFGKIVPHIAPETMTIMSIFGGIMFGPTYGLFLVLW